MQGNNKKQNKILPIQHEVITSFDYKEYFKTEEGKRRIEELYLIGNRYFSSVLSKDKKSILYENLINKKRELEEMIGEKIEFDNDGKMHVFTYARK